jgi:hypothetical protein
MEECVMRGKESWKRSVAMKYVGWVFLVGAFLLILGGAYRVQSNMIHSGLLFLSLSLIYAPNIIKRSGWPLKVAICMLAVTGAFYVFIT